MNPERFAQVRRLFEAALEQKPERRAAFVEEAGADDAELREEVRRLLEARDHHPEFLERPPAITGIGDGGIHAPVFATGRTVSGRFEIVGLLGAGGIGEVYHARDHKLRRDVALKVIAAGRAVTADRKWRFLQEARAASALNHANIATVYDIGEEDGVEYIAMEYVEGQSLDNLIPREGLKLQDALRYGVQIADALAAAHAAGIVHRDVKPGNVMVARNDAVKVLDFGLAKLIGPVSVLETSIGKTPATADGMIVGTVSYMSPEQAEGKPVDARCDVFSFGCVVYEMLTGRRPFEGESQMATLAAVLRNEPASVKDLAPGVPAEVERVVMRCLRKDPLDRFQHMEEVKVAVQELRELSNSGRLAAAPTGRGRKWRWLTAGLAALVFAVLLPAWWYKRTTPKSGELKLEKITNDAGLTADPALSPDGKLIAYASDRDSEGDLELWVQQVAGGDPVRLTYNDFDDRSPVFSPDSTHIAYRSERGGGGIYLISALGGKERLLVAEGRGPQFSPDGKQMAFWIGNANPGDILAPSSGKVYVMSLEAGSSRLLRPDFIVSRQPIWSSSGSSLLFVGYPGDGSNPSATFDWWVVPRDGGPPVRTGALQAPELAGAGQVLSRAKLEAEPFAWRDDRVFFTGYDGDAHSLWRAVLRQSDPKFAGPPERLTHSTGDQYGTSFDGQRLAFSAGEGRNAIWILPADTVRGIVTGPVKQIIEHGNYLASPSMSLDGGVLAYGSGSDRNLNIDIFLKRLGTGETVTLASTPDTEAWPRVLPDGSAIFYERRRFAPTFERMVFRVSPAGGDNRKICDNCGAWAVSPDGEWLVSKIMGRTFTEQTVYQVSTGQRSDLLQRDKVGIYQPNFSNDGRWLVFMGRSGPERARLYLTRFRGLRPIPDSEWAPITPDNWKVDVPRWSPDDRIIYFTAEPDGYRCIYAQRINWQTKAPEGEAYAVYHSHNARRSLRNTQFGSVGISVGRNGIAFLMGEITSNAWLAILPHE